MTLHPTHAQVCELLGIGGNPASAYSICRNKHLSRVCLKENNLNTPKSALIRSVADVPAAMKEVPFPLVVKPTAYVSLHCRAQLWRSLVQCACMPFAIVDVHRACCAENCRAPTHR